MPFKPGDRVRLIRPFEGGGMPHYPGVTATIIDYYQIEPSRMVIVKWDPPFADSAGQGVMADRFVLAEPLSPFQEALQSYIRSELSNDP